MDLIINSHKNLICGNLDYTILDPEFKSNSIKGKISSQSEIIQHILSNNLDEINIKYTDKYIIQYTTIDTNKIKLSPIEPNAVHLLRLIGLKTIPKYSYEFDLEIETEYIADMILKITDQINLNPMDLCSVCGAKLKVLGMNKISSCDKQTCQVQSRHLVMDNIIITQYKKDPYLCEILLDLLISGAHHPKKEKIFKPLPIIKNVSNIDELIKLIEQEALNLDIHKLSLYSNDIELYRNIGLNAYAIILNAISDNYFSLNTIEKFQTEVLSRGRLGDIETAFDSKNIKFIGLNYSYEVESQFKKEYFLFHGSPMQCWYPIIKNGLKVMSGTEFMTSGAAYGNGIYLSDQFSMSLGYSSNHRNINNKDNNNRCIVGVFEVAGGIEAHKKSSSIYVVSNDKIILLRYLIVVEQNVSSSFYQELSDYFVKYLGSINKMSEKKSVNIKNKRFNAEMKLLNSNSKINSVEMIDELSNWKIKLNEIGGKKIVLNTYFNDYPKLPPKISLEYDENLMVKKNICDNKSNLNISEINPSKWEITTNLSKIVDIVYECVEKSK